MAQWIGDGREVDAWLGRTLVDLNVNKDVDNFGMNAQHSLRQAIWIYQQWMNASSPRKFIVMYCGKTDAIMLAWVVLSRHKFLWLDQSIVDRESFVVDLLTNLLPKNSSMHSVCLSTRMWNREWFKMMHNGAKATESKQLLMMDVMMCRRSHVNCRNVASSPYLQHSCSEMW